MTGMCSSVGSLKSENPLGKFSEVPLDVHNGLTCDGPGKRPEYRDEHWYGWRYDRNGDATFKKPDIGHQWLVHEVREEIKKAIPQFKKLLEEAQNG